MPGKGHYIIFAYESSVWHSYSIKSPGECCIYDLIPGSDWWDGRSWSYRRTVNVGIDEHGEPYVPMYWRVRAYAKTEGEWTPRTPGGTDLWVTEDGTHWTWWYSPMLLWQWQTTHPYKGWYLMRQMRDPYWGRLSKL